MIRQINNLIGGYYLSSPEYSDVAVLSVPSFVGLSAAEQSFQQVAFDFIAQSKAAGKTKLIIDVSANGGGTILQGYSLFTNLFPDLVPYGATRFRAHEAFDIMGQVVSSVAGPDVSTHENPSFFNPRPLVYSTPPFCSSVLDF